MSQPNVYFIRHSLGDAAAVRALFDGRLCGVDYDDGNSLSTNPADYKGKVAKRTLSAIAGMIKENPVALVAADYRRITKREMLVGCVDQNYGFRGEAFGDANLKVFHLAEVRTLSYRDWPIFSAAQPQQSTFSLWPSMAENLRSWYFTGALPRKCNGLHFSQLEVLCFHWCTQYRGLKHLLAPLGRGLRDVDIAGTMQSGGRFFAQVTFTSNAAHIADKANRLNQVYNHDDVRILFCDTPTFARVGSVEIIPNSIVFDQSDPELLDSLLGVAGSTQAS